MKSDSFQYTVALKSGKLVKQLRTMAGDGSTVKEDAECDQRKARDMKKESERNIEVDE